MCFLWSLVDSRTLAKELWLKRPAAPRIPLDAGLVQNEKKNVENLYRCFPKTTLADWYVHLNERVLSVV
jgi:hypothetical protein